LPAFEALSEANSRVNQSIEHAHPGRQLTVARIKERHRGGAVGKVRLRYFVCKESGFCYWRLRRMRALGFRLVPLGKDGPPQPGPWPKSRTRNGTRCALGRPLLLSTYPSFHVTRQRLFGVILPDRSGLHSNVISEIQSGRLTPSLPEIKSGGQLGFAFATCREKSRPTQSLSR
jgi:hypothetical protein